MGQTIVGVFESFERANDVADRLADAGIPRSQVHVHAREGDTAYAPDAGADEPHRGFVESIQDFFSNLFGDDDRREEVGHYSEAVRRGGALLSVDVQDEAEVATVQSLMEEGGAEDIDAKVAAWQSTGYTGFDTQAAPYTAEEIEAERQAIPVVREELVVGKREVDTGRVRVYSRQTNTPVSESVNLREERATIERRPVDREATEADLQGGTVEVRETAEEAVVGKSSRVVEEVVVGKEATERTETVHENLRGTEVQVERAEGTVGSAPTTPASGKEAAYSTGGSGVAGAPRTTGTSGTTGATGAPGAAGTTGTSGTTGTTGTTGTSGATGTPSTGSSGTSTTLPDASGREPRDL